MTSKRTGERGFTLTELLVAMTVTIIGLAGLLSLHVTTIRGNASASQAAEAVAVAEQALEDIRREPIARIETVLYEPITGTEWSGTSSSHLMTPITGRTGQVYQPVVRAVQLTPPSLVRFRIIVYWMDGGADLPLPADLAADADHSIEVQMIRTRVEVL